MAENRKAERFELKEVRIRLVSEHTLYSEKPLSSPEAAVEVIKKEMADLDREVLCVVNLNNKLRPINFNIVSVGDVSTTIAAIPNVLKSGLLSNASAFLMIHNHPSGDPTPSDEDILMTKRVIEAGKLMGLPCMDHIIVADGGEIISMNETGYSNFSSPGISMTAEAILRPLKHAKAHKKTKHCYEER